MSPVASVAGLAGVPPAMTLSLLTPRRGEENSSKTKPNLIPEKSSRVGAADPAMRETIRVSLIRQAEGLPLCSTHWAGEPWEAELRACQ